MQMVATNLLKKKIIAKVAVTYLRNIVSHYSINLTSRGCKSNKNFK